MDMTSLFSMEAAAAAAFTQQCCSCDASSARCWCVDCNEALCDACVSAHRRVTVTRSHRILNQPPAGGVSTPPTKFCRFHPSEPLKLYCFTCQRLTCRDCQLTAHMNHRYKFVREALDSLKKQLEVRVLPIRLQGDRVKWSLQDMETRLKDIAENESCLKVELQQSYSILTQHLKNRMTEILKDVEKVYKEESERIQTRMRRMKHLKHVQECVMATAEKVRNSSDLSALQTSLNQIESQLKDLPDVSTSPPQTMSELKVVTDQLSLQTILNFGTLQVIWVPFSVSQTSNQNTPASASASNSTSTSASTSLSTFTHPPPPYRPLPQTRTTGDSPVPVSVPLTTSTRPAPITCPSTSRKSSSLVNQSKMDQSATTSAVQHLSSMLSKLEQNSPRQVLMIKPVQPFSAHLPPSAGPSPVLAQPALVLNQPTASHQNQSATSLLNITQTVYQVSCLPPVVPQFPMLVSQASPGNTWPKQQKCLMGNNIPVQFSPASVSSKIPPTATTGNQISVRPSQTLPHPPPTSSLPSSAQRLAPDTGPHSSSSLGQQQQSPVVRAVADSACDSSVQQVAARRQEPAENEPTSTVSEEPAEKPSAPEEPEPEPKVLDKKAEEPEPKVSDREGDKPEPKPKLSDKEAEEPEPEILDKEAEEPEPEVLDKEAEEPDPKVLDRECDKLELKPEVLDCQVDELEPEPEVLDKKAKEPKPEVLTEDSEDDELEPESEPSDSEGDKLEPEPKVLDKKAEEPKPEVSDSEDDELEPESEPSDSEGDELEPEPDVWDSEGDELEPEPKVLDKKAEEPKPEVSDSEDDELEPESEPSDCEDDELEPDVWDSEDDELEPEPDVWDSEGDEREPEPDAWDSEDDELEPELDVWDSEGDELESEPEVSDSEAEEPGSVIARPVSSLRQWQPSVSLFRLPVSRPGPGRPLPRFRLVAGDAEDEFYLKEIEDTQSQTGDVTDDIITKLPSSPESPATLTMVACSACQSANSSIICSFCGRGYHRDCHLPTVGPYLRSEWMCSLCQDLSDPSDPFSSDRPPRPDSPCLSLQDQRRCESLLLYLKVKGCTRLPQCQLTVVSERLSLCRSPSYGTVAEFLSDIRSLFKDASRDNDDDDDVLTRLQANVSRRWNRGLSPELRDTDGGKPAVNSDMLDGEQAAERLAGSKVKTEEEEEAITSKAKLKETRKRLRQLLDQMEMSPSKRAKTNKRQKPR